MKYPKLSRIAAAAFLFLLLGGCHVHLHVHAGGLDLIDPDPESARPQTAAELADKAYSNAVETDY